MEWQSKDRGKTKKQKKKKIRREEKRAKWRAFALKNDFLSKFQNTQTTNLI